MSDEQITAKQYLDWWYRRAEQGDGLDYMCFVCSQPCTEAEAWATSYIAERIAFGSTETCMHRGESYRTIDSTK